MSSASSGSDASQELERYSCSSFAGRKENGMPVADIWLLDRASFSIRMRPHEKFPSKNVIQMYEKYTAFYMPPKSRDQENLHVLQPLSADFKKYINHLQMITSEPLENQIWHHIAPYLGLIYQLSAAAREKLTNIKEHKVLEADSRMKWDILVLFLLRSDQDSALDFSVNSGSERALKLPRSKLADQIQTDRNSKKWVEHLALLNMYQNFHSSERSLLREHPQHSTNFHQALSHLVQSYYQPTTKREFVKNVHSSPSKAVVDSLAMLSVPINILPQNIRSRLDNMKSLHFEKEPSRTPDVDDNFVVVPKESNITEQKVVADDQETVQAEASKNYLQVPPSNPSTKTKQKVPQMPHPHDVVRDPSSGAQLSSQLFSQWVRTSGDQNGETEMAHFGYVIHEYKRPLAPDHSDIARNMRQLRMSLVSAVTYLEHLGITDFPIFGVAVNGYLALVIVAWSGILNGNRCIYLGDRDIVQYNLADPVSAYNYGVFISSLALIHGPRLLGVLRASNVQLANHGVEWVIDEQKEEFIKRGYEPLPVNEQKKKTNKPPQTEPKIDKTQDKPQPVSIPSVQLIDHELVESSQAGGSSTSTHHMITRSKRVANTGNQTKKPNEQKQEKKGTPNLGK